MEVEEIAESIKVSASEVYKVYEKSLCAAFEIWDKEYII